MHQKRYYWIIMIHIRVTKAHKTSNNYRIQISFLIQLKIGIEIELKIFEDQLYITRIWYEPKNDFLISIYFPMLKSGKLHWNNLFIILPFKFELNICNIQINFTICDVFPIKAHSECFEEYVKMIVIFMRQVNIKIHEVR